MFKKLLIASAILAATSTGAFAYGQWGPGVPYVGASLGNETITMGGGANYYGFTGNLSIGYGGMVYPCIYLGGELFGVPGSATEKDRHVAPNSAKATWGWGGSLNPGIFLNDKFLLYVRAGGEQRHFSGPNVNRGGWLVGAGVQTNVMCNWDFRAEYVATDYGRSNRTNGSTPFVETVNAGLVYKIT